MAANVEEITAKVQDELTGTIYECTELELLTGGSANYLYKGTLKSPLEDATKTVVVKHAEGYVATNPAFTLATERGGIETTALTLVFRGLGPVSTPGFLIQAPNCLYYNPKTSTQIQEYKPDSINLKSYALKHWNPTPPEVKIPCQAIGRGLGAWLKRFHDWADAPHQEELKEAAKKNVAMAKLKNMINYGWMVERMEQKPEILGDARDTIMAVVEKASNGLQGDVGVIHGDFWSGNVLLTDKPVQEQGVVDISIIDWELIQMGVRPMDLGQMIAELYELKLFKNIDAGIWVIEGFTEGYQGGCDDEFVFHILMYVATHLICFSSVPGWGSPKQVDEVIALGRDILVNSWKRDKSWFMDMPLGCLFDNLGRMH